MGKIRGILINLNVDVHEDIYIENKLEEFYRVLECRCIDIVTRKIGNKEYSIICDEEGRLKSKYFVTYSAEMDFDKYDDENLVGNIFVVKTDNNDKLVSLTEKEIQEVLKHLVQVESYDIKHYAIIDEMERGDNE